MFPRCCVVLSIIDENGGSPGEEAVFVRVDPLAGQLHRVIIFARRGELISLFDAPYGLRKRSAAEETQII